MFAGLIGLPDRQPGADPTGAVDDSSTGSTNPAAAVVVDILYQTSKTAELTAGPRVRSGSRIGSAPRLPSASHQRWLPLSAWMWDRRAFVLDLIGLLARLGLAAVFLFSGVSKAVNPRETRVAVRAYDLLPDGLVGAVAEVLPYLEIALGLLLLLGMVVRWTGVD